MDDRNWICDQVTAAAHDAADDCTWYSAGPDAREAAQDEADDSWFEFWQHLS